MINEEIEIEEKKSKEKIVEEKDEETKMLTRFEKRKREEEMKELEKDVIAVHYMKIEKDECF